ncbi:D-aminoacyl-tRNA deacylase [hydrothermal vent metagenome]|uniref:D-aminoacyl-tRNA deacylase n=1 Tax=hydrothermal vent metagenome TaxID=652676 RepID=A0A3B0YRU4_9ZZZZ
MIALLQRVKDANVKVNSQVVGEIESGLLIFLAIEKNDSEGLADKLLTRLLAYRVFADEFGKMNLSLTDCGDGLLIVSQFTLAADTQKGSRPGFSPAADPEKAKQLYHYFIERAEKRHAIVASGRFGADMQVRFTNDGPVTFWLQVKDK